MRFSRQSRLTASGDFQKVRQGGRSKAGSALVLNVLPRPGLERPRAGFITPKYLGIAVLRNQVRRRLRAVYRQASPCLLPEFYLVTIARHSAAHYSYEALWREWRWLARQLNVWQDRNINPVASALPTAEIAL